MTIQEQIAAFEAKTKEIREANPSISNISWKIENASLSEMKQLKGDDQMKVDYNSSCATACVAIRDDRGVAIGFIHIRSKKLKPPQLVEA